MFSDRCADFLRLSNLQHRHPAAARATEAAKKMQLDVQCSSLPHGSLFLSPLDQEVHVT